MVALGKVLKMTTIANGVDTHEQERFVRIIGCDQGQGFRYSLPVSADELFEMLTSKKRSFQYRDDNIKYISPIRQR